MTGIDSRYDIFISYARDDGDWVRRHLYEPLMRCRTAQGMRPKVFLDLDKEGVPPGVNFMVFLAEAIASSRTVVAVYSPAYFSKSMCQWELSKAAELDPTGAEGKLTPILIDRAAEDRVPLHVSGINFIHVSRPDWFEVLSKSLGLEPPEEPSQLEFREQLEEVTVHHTLPPLTVAVVHGGKEVRGSEIVTLTLEGGALQGTVSIPAVDGLARFEDLSIPTELESTRLVASAEGCLPAFSRSFCVHPASEARPESEESTIRLSGETVFFEDENAVAVLTSSEVGVFGPSGDELVAVQVSSRPRLVRRGGSQVALAFWSGKIELLGSQGERSTWELAPETGEYAIPGDLKIDGTTAFVGFWGGKVFRLSAGEEAAPELDHPAGVQRLAVAGNRFYVCGLDGALCIYEEGRMIRSHQLERTIRYLEPLGKGLVAVGEKRLYRVPFRDGQVLSVEMPLEGAKAVHGGSPLPVVIDGRGKGIVFDEELSIRLGFHAGSGAEPVSTDQGGRYCVVRNPDGSNSLVELGAAVSQGAKPSVGRVVFSHAEGGLAVAPSGGRFALGGVKGTRVLPASAMRGLIGTAADA